MLPFVGVKVVEMTKTIAGFYAGMILADMGAEGVRVERPEVDPARDAGPVWRAAKFVAFNRNKKSVAIDLNSTRGKDILRRLLQTTDVFVEDFDRNVINDLGFSYEAVAELNPMTVYVSLKDCLEGPYEDRVWTDGIIEAESGLMSRTGECEPLQPLTEQPPVRLGVPLATITASIFAAMWAMGALLTRDVMGKGEHIRVGRFESATFMLGSHIMDYSMYKYFKKQCQVCCQTKDGGWVHFDHIERNDLYWKKFCETFDVPEKDYLATAKRENRQTPEGLAGDLAYIYIRDTVKKIERDAAKRFTKAEC